MKCNLLLAFFMLLTVDLVAQPNSLGFPSPNNSFLGSITGGSGISADLYTGTAQVNIPICNLASKELSIPVSLNYTAGRGIRLQDYASSVGLGWQLNAGGSISRVVRGFPDEFPNGYLGTDLTGQKLEAYFNGAGNFPSGVDNGLNVPTKDGEPDIYFVRTPYFAFQFTFDGNGNAVFNNETGMKITSSSFFASSTYQYSTFTIKDPAGNTYSFGSSRETSTTTLYGTNYTFTTTWYLSHISTLNNKDYATFSYLSSSGNDVLPHYQRTRTYNMYGCQDNNNDPVPLTINQPKYISTITTPTGQIDFTYLYDRSDITTAARLTGVTLKSSGGLGVTTLQTYAFDHSYFGSPSLDPKRLRLKLNKITVAGGTTATATPMDYRVFTYNTTENLPARDEQVFDYWGYYTAFPLPGSDPMADPTLRIPNEAKTKANILTSIKELTGSTWVIDYEQNSYYKTSGGTNANVAVGGLRVKSISQTLQTGENIQMFYSYQDNTGKSTGQVLTEAYRNLVLTIFGLQRVFSEAPANIYDVNGTFIGYSSVKTSYQNGGYIVSEFYNFSDHPDVFDYSNPAIATAAPNMTSSVNFAFKRGLPVKLTEYDASGSKISEVINNYSSLTTPGTKKAWAYRWYVAAAASCGSSGATTINSRYYVNVENYRLQSATVRKFDQADVARYIQNTTSYTYCANNRNVKTITTTDSKTNPVVKTIYHADDAAIPMITTSEQTALTNMVGNNNIDAIIHESHSKNGAITQNHHSYDLVDSKVYLAASSAYRDNTLLTTQQFVYDRSTSDLISSSATGTNSESIMYGYNNLFPIATVSNASSYYVPEPGSGSFGNIFTGSYSASFTVDYTGTIGWNVYPAGFTGSATVYYTLYGPTYQSGSFCLGSGCSSYGTASWTNMAPGSYYISFYVSGSGSGDLYCSGTYPKYIPALKREFYYQGFEEMSWGNYVIGSAHTGNKYWNASSTPYNIDFVLPNGRSYVMQWWNWENGKWKFNETAYTGPRTLSGVIDDIRIFPGDAQMTTFTHLPLVGQTGQTDPSGRSMTSEYDGLQRINITRDNDNNIISKNCYNYLGQTISCPVATVYSSTAKSGTFTRNNCPSGYIGSTVVYNIPAGTYTSAVSQADADQKAVNDVNTNGQAYANTFPCTQVWYNVEKSGYFTRNNCGSGSTPSGPVLYTVQAGIYSSTVSQADADQKAQDDVNANGQNFANANSYCISGSCSFSMMPGYASPTNNISASGGSVSFYIVFYSTSSTLTAGNTYTIANINGSCVPSGTRTLNLTSGTTSWEVKIYSNGQVQAKLLSGTLNSGSTAYFSSSYTL